MPAPVKTFRHRLPLTVTLELKDAGYVPVLQWGVVLLVLWKERNNPVAHRMLLANSMEC